MGHKNHPTRQFVALWKHDSLHRSILGAHGTANSS